jgi:hypothetical protein
MEVRKATKSIIADLEKEGKLKFLGPGFWKDHSSRRQPG